MTLCVSLQATRLPVWALRKSTGGTTCLESSKMARDLHSNELSHTSPASEILTDFVSQLWSLALHLHGRAVLQTFFSPWREFLDCLAVMAFVSICSGTFYTRLPLPRDQIQGFS